jgi:hypothetical protein
VIQWCFVVLSGEIATDIPRAWLLRINYLQESKFLTFLSVRACASLVGQFNRGNVCQPVKEWRHGEILKSEAVWRTASNARNDFSHHASFSAIEFTRAFIILLLSRPCMILERIDSRSRLSEVALALVKRSAARAFITFSSPGASCLKI